MGDPAGCVPHITVKTWNALRSEDVRPFFVIGDPRLYKGAIPIEVIEHPSQAPAVFAGALPVLPMKIERFEELTPGTPFPASGAATMRRFSRS